MNKFNIGSRVWVVEYSESCFDVIKCLVVRVDSVTASFGNYGAVEEFIKGVQYSLYPITKEDGIELLCSGSDIITALERRVFSEKDEAFSFLDNEILELRKELENE